MPIEGTYLTVPEAAAALGISPASVRRAIADGTLAAVKVGARMNVIDPAEVERYRAEHLGRQGWEKRRTPGYTPNPKTAEYSRAYRERKRKKAQQQPATPAEEE